MGEIGLSENKFLWVLNRFRSDTELNQAAYLNAAFIGIELGRKGSFAKTPSVLKALTFLPRGPPASESEKTRDWHLSVKSPQIRCLGPVFQILLLL